MNKEILGITLYNKLTKDQKTHYKSAMEITLNEDEIMTDQQVQKLLGIYQRTLYTWRKCGLIRYFKLRSRNYYLKTLLLLDFIEITNEQ